MFSVTARRPEVSRFNMGATWLSTWLLREKDASESHCYKQCPVDTVIEDVTCLISQSTAQGHCHGILQQKHANTRHPHTCPHARTRALTRAHTHRQGEGRGVRG